MNVIIQWWYIGAFLIVMGLGFIAFGGTDNKHYCGFFSGPRIFGILVFLMGVQWIIYGGLSRCFP